MKNVLKISVAFAVAALSFSACGDDSSSNASTTSSAKYILDEANQRFGIIYDRCYITENSTRWDENVDTTFFRYKFEGDALIVSDDNEHDELFTMTGGKAGSIFGTWKTSGIAKDYGDGDVEYSTLITTLRVTDHSLNFASEFNTDICYAEDELLYKAEDLLSAEFDIDEDDFDLESDGCETVQIKYDGKKYSYTETMDIDSDGILHRETSFSGNGKSCTKKLDLLDEIFQYPKSVCNEKDMSSHMEKIKRKNAKGEKDYSGYLINEYENESISYEEFVECIANALGVEI